MKIQWEGKLPPTPPSNTDKASAQGVESPRFADTLQSAMGTPKAASSNAPAIATGGLSNVRPPMEIIATGVWEVDTTALVATAESMLNYLEQFGTQLSDAAIDVKTLQPAIEQLSNEKAELSDLFGRLAEDHPLKEVVGNLLDTVLTLLGQYHRGDWGH